MKKEKNKFLSYAAMFLIAATLIVCSNVKQITAQAADAEPVSNIAQQGLEKTSIQLTWTSAADVVSYRVYYKVYKDDDSNYRVMDTNSKNGCTITGLLPGEKYDIKIQVCGGANAGATVYFKDGLTKIDQLKGLKQFSWWDNYVTRNSLDTFEVVWEPSSAADGYDLILYDKKNRMVSQVNSTESEYTFRKVKNEVYTVKVRAYMTYQNQKYYTPWVSVKCMNQGRIKSVKVSGDKLKLIWVKVDGATGYDIYVSANKYYGYKKAASVDKNKSSYSVNKFQGKKFSSKKTYYVYVETVCKTKKNKSTSVAFEYWNSKTGSKGYIN